MVVVLIRKPPENVDGGSVPLVGSWRVTSAALRACTPASRVDVSVYVDPTPLRTLVAMFVAGGTVSKVRGPAPPGPTEIAACSAEFTHIKPRKIPRHFPTDVNTFILLVNYVE